MQATDPYSPGLALQTEGGTDRLRVRLKEIKEEIGSKELTRMESILDETERTNESIRDAISTRLMEGFRTVVSKRCFGLLYELNSQHLVTQVASRLRRYTSNLLVYAYTRTVEHLTSKPQYTGRTSASGAAPQGRGRNDAIDHSPRSISEPVEPPHPVYGMSGSRWPFDGFR